MNKRHLHESTAVACFGGRKNQAKSGKPFVGFLSFLVKYVTYI